MRGRRRVPSCVLRSVSGLSPPVDIQPCAQAEVLALQAELGCSGALAQILVRRGLADPAAARRWLAADEAHDPERLGGMGAATELVLRHVAAGTRITVHGDYDVDGVCSTTILLNALERLGADADWFLPSRREDGYGLSRATVERLAARGTRLLITVDCGITAVEEVAAARAAGLDVLVTDHHTARTDGVLPDCPIVHPGLDGSPTPELCAAGVAHKLAQGLLRAAGRDPAVLDEDLDLVALATVADCVPLVGENRRLVRTGLRAIAGTRKPGLRALMERARVDPSAVDTTSIGFRLAPRINAAGRMQRADAGVELLRTRDPERAGQIAEELERLNTDRRHTEQRTTFAAEAQVAELEGLREAAGFGPAPAYVVAGDGWHPGVIGIVASRIAERRHRPVVVVSFADESATQGTGSGRSISGFDLLGGLQACAAELDGFGGHRAAAGCTLQRTELEAFRAAFCAHAEAALTPDLLERRARADAVVSGDELGLELAEELERLAPFGIGNPQPRLLVPAAELLEPRPMGEGRHLRFAVASGGRRARAVAFQTTSLPEGFVDATFLLERNEWNGVVEPRLVLQGAEPCAPAPIALVGEPEEWADAVRAELGHGVASQASPGPERASGRTVIDRRGAGLAGLVAALVATSEPVLVICADARRRRRHLAPRIGGFAICSWRSLEQAPELVDGYTHLVALDPPAHTAQRAILRRGVTSGSAHEAWGEAELGFAVHVHDEQHALRDQVTAAYRLLRANPDELPAALSPAPVAAARVLAVLDELGLVVLDRTALTLTVPAFVGRTELERSATFTACAQRPEEAFAWLRPVHPQAA